MLIDRPCCRVFSCASSLLPVVDTSEKGSTEASHYALRCKEEVPVCWRIQDALKARSCGIQSMECALHDSGRAWTIFAPQHDPSNLPMNVPPNHSNVQLSVEEGDTVDTVHLCFPRSHFVLSARGTPVHLAVKSLDIFAV